MTQPARVSRRTLFGGILAAAAVSGLAACASGSQTPAANSTVASDAEADPGAFPVTIAHAFGDTTLDRAPSRVATIGWTDQDMVLALGVVPVGATALTWGGNAAKSSDWFDAALAEAGGTQPVRYDDTNGTPVEEIAKVTPDLILATNSGITADDYAKLSKIAPVVAFPDQPWVTSWQDSLKMIGQALGRNTAAEEIRTATDKVIADGKAQYPTLAETTFVFGYLTAADLSTIGIYGPEDNRVRAMNAFGLVNAPIVDEVVNDGEFYGQLSAERAADVDAQVFLGYAETAEELATYTQNPLLGQIPALKSGNAYLESDKTIGLSITNPSPLSLPFIVQNYLPKVAAVVPQR